MLQSFREFLFKQNAFALALGVIIGGAVSKVVDSIVSDLVMPVLGVLLPGGHWREAKWVLSGENAIRYGNLLGRLVDFFIVAVVVFLLTRMFLREEAKKAA